MLSRRALLIGSAALVGGVAIGYYRPERAERRERQELEDAMDLEAGQRVITPYVVIDRTGITVITPRAEMGQGIHTGLAALIAEELDAPLDELRVEHGPASVLYRNNVLIGQLTGGQTSTQDAFVKMRKAGAAARLMLLEAAATRLGVSSATLKTSNGRVIGAGSTIAYTDLAAEASLIDPPQDPPLKPQEQWTLLGKSLPRIDMVGKCTGTAQYAADIRLPGLLYATVKRNPHLGGRMLGYDAEEALKMRGVERVIPIDDGVIVVATNTWYAMRAASRIQFDWEPAPYPATTEGHRAQIDNAMQWPASKQASGHGDVDSVFDSEKADTEIIEGHYRVPYVAHATMEPLNATALYTPDRIDIWAGNQWPTKAVEMATRLTGLPESSVRVHTTYMGGGFGRRLELDDVYAAISAAYAMPGQPVSVTYSREEDMRHDAYRPMASARFRAAVAGGRPTALSLDVSVPSLFYSAALRDKNLIGKPAVKPPGKDVSTTMGLLDHPYQLDHYRITAHRPPNLLPVGWWRSVGESQNVFFHDSVIDELSYAARADPVQMRLSMLSHAPSRAVLDSVTQMSRWGKALPVGQAMGVAYAKSSRAASAMVIHISHEQGVIRILNVYGALDVGIALDPRNIEAQMQGSMHFGLCAAIHGEITVSDGVVDQGNFDTYPLLRIHQVPKMEMRIHTSGDEIFGVGESMTPTAAPALGNAIFAATGKRIRELPFCKSFRFA